MRLLPAIKKVKRSVQNLIETLTAVFTGTISLKYAYYRKSVNFLKSTEIECTALQMQ
jgi:hypothetical protein